MTQAASSQVKYPGDTVDVLIVGGGMVGAALALGLNPLGLRIRVLEASALDLDSVGKNKPVHSPSFDARSTALSWGSRGIFEQMGLWSALSQHVAPIERIHVSERGRFGVTRLSAAEMQVEALGYVIQNQWLGQCLYGALSQCCNVTVEVSSSVTELSRLQHENGEILTHVSWKHASWKQGDDVQSCRTRLLVIADGASSSSCRLLGIDQSVEEYAQHAVIANLMTSKPHQQVAYERFTPNGPMAMLPLEEPNSVALVWTVTDEEVDAVKAYSEPDFAASVLERFGERLGHIVKVGQRATYPLRLVQAREQVRPGVVVLGNAAHSLHPVAGQGFNLALRGVALLVEHLARSLKHGPDLPALTDSDRQSQNWYDFNVLQAFQNERQSDQNQTIVFSDQVTKVFTSENAALGVLRDIGLIGLEAFPMFRQIFARQAMGMGGREARLDKGFAG